ncbi:MAG: hypothetical protein Q7S33_01075 [Nanoarchaeota archaeon]|nr:hypothetical protein [Nanoarchaeota archaeon]
MAIKCFDYEDEDKKLILAPRIQFRNMYEFWGPVSFGFPLKLIERDDNKPYDLYEDLRSLAVIYVVGGDKHCNAHGQLEKYKEGIAVQCKKKDKEDIIKQISRIVYNGRK